jgi:hypothetical protein
MTTLEISTDFTLEDIRKIRDYAYYRRLEIGNEAYEEEAHREAMSALAILNRLKAQKREPQRAT